METFQIINVWYSSLYLLNIVFVVSIVLKVMLIVFPNCHHSINKIQFNTPWQARGEGRSHLAPPLFFVAKHNKRRFCTSSKSCSKYSLIILEFRMLQCINRLQHMTNNNNNILIRQIIIKRQLELRAVLLELCAALLEAFSCNLVAHARDTF